MRRGQIIVREGLAKDLLMLHMAGQSRIVCPCGAESRPSEAWHFGEPLDAFCERYMRFALRHHWCGIGHVISPLEVVPPT